MEARQEIEARELTEQWESIGNSRKLFNITMVRNVVAHGISNYLVAFGGVRARLCLGGPKLRS